MGGRSGGFLLHRYGQVTTSRLGDGKLEGQKKRPQSLACMSDSKDTAHYRFGHSDKFRFFSESYFLVSFQNLTIRIYLDF